MIRITALRSIASRIGALSLILLTLGVQSAAARDEGTIPGLQSKSMTVRVDRPATSASPIRLSSDDGRSISISLPGRSSANGSRGLTATSVAGSKARVITPLISRYNEVLVDTDSLVEDVAGSVRISMITKSATAPRIFVFPLTLPAGAQLKVQPDGSVIALAPSETGMSYFAGVKAPYAYDAAGRAVPTEFRVSGSTLTQTIFPPVDAAYPIVSDPWLGKNLIQEANWVRHTEGWTLQVTPTAWQRFWNGYWPGAAGWDELYARYRWSGLTTNLEGMRDQYICHVQIVSVRAPERPTWNLDEWRPNVGYTQTINSYCNPGGAKWFD